MAMDGPAGGRPCMSTALVPPPRKKFTMMSSTCACRIDGAWKYSPAAAVPVSTKMPEPMMAPMPSAVSDHGPSVFCRRWPGDSDSEISLSIDLQQRSWLSEVRMTSAGSVSCDKRLWSPESQLSAIGTQHSASECLYCSKEKRPLAKCQAAEQVGTAALG